MPKPTEVSDSEVAVVRQMLKQMDPLLDIEWFPVATYDAETDDWEGRYAIVCKWPEVDKRWEMYRRGEIGWPYDKLGWFVEPGEDDSLQNGSLPPVSPLELMDKVVKWLGRMDNTRSTWRDRMKSAIEHNRRLQDKRAADVIDEGVEGFKYYHSKMASQPIVNLGGGRSNVEEK